MKQWVSSFSLLSRSRPAQAINHATHWQYVRFRRCLIFAASTVKNARARCRDRRRPAGGGLCGAVLPGPDCSYPCGCARVEDRVPRLRPEFSGVQVRAIGYSFAWYV